MRSMSGLGRERPRLSVTLNGSYEPKVRDAAIHVKVSFVELSSDAETLPPTVFFA